MYVKEFFSKESNITENDLRLFLTSNTERAKIEFKSSISNKRDAILESITSFANSLGGLLILGISDTAEIIGLDRKETKEKINQIVRDSIEPEFFSSAHYYDIHEIRLSNSRNVFLIDVKTPPFIVGFQFDRNYYYYGRKGNSKSLLTPQELYFTSLLKGTYNYNLLYRNRILDALTPYNDLYDLLTNRESETMKSEIKRLILRNESGGLETDYTKLLKLINNTDLKTLSLTVKEVLLKVYVQILNIRLTIKHSRELSEEEDQALNELFDEFSECFRLNQRPKANEVRYAMRNKVENYGEMSLEGYFYSYLGPLLETHLHGKTMNDFIIDNKFYMWSYDKKLADLRKLLIEACTKLGVPEEVKEHILKIYDEFPETFLGSLIPLMHKLENYKIATRKALYLENDYSDN